MLHQPTLEKLEAMRLHGMAQAWRELAKSEQAAELSFEERMALLVDRQFTWRENEAFAGAPAAGETARQCLRGRYRLSRGARSGQNAVAFPGVASAWVEQHENVFVCGPTGVGKSFLACALAQKACRDGYSAFYTRAAALFRDLALARADGSLRNMLLRLSRIDVLVVDDWAMTPLSEAEARDFWEICEDRCQTRSLVLTSQMPVAKWHSQIGDSTVAEGILDRIVHRAHRIELKGDSMRKNPTEASRSVKGRSGLLSAEGKGPQMPAPSPAPIPAATQVSLRFAPDRGSRKTDRFLLPFRSLSGRIKKPASLRSDLADRSQENGDRNQRRMSDRFRENPQQRTKRTKTETTAEQTRAAQAGDGSAGCSRTDYYSETRNATSLVRILQSSRADRRAQRRHRSAIRLLRRVSATPHRKLPCTADRH